MSTINITHSPSEVKTLARSAAIEAGQKDPQCKHKGFTLVKSMLPGGLYDYNPGRGTLLKTDVPQAYYYRTMRGTWMHKAIEVKK
jgi:hypothetical protein